MNDALFQVSERVQANTKLFCVVTQGLNLDTAGLVSDGLINGQRRCVVVLSGNREVQAADGTSGLAQTIKSLRTGYFVNEVEVDVDEIGGAVFAFDDQVVVPHFFRKSSWFVHPVILLRVRSRFCRTHLDHAGNSCHGHRSHNDQQ